jgi:hypothetical protein
MQDQERFAEVGEGVPRRRDESAGEPVPAWEQVADGRYMPRRVRGSCLGRELG